jgi:hypothetical protein
LLPLVVASANKTNMVGSCSPHLFLLPHCSHSCITNNDVAHFLLGKLTLMVKQPKAQASSDGDDGFGCHRCYCICKWILNGNFNNISCKITSH